MTYDQRRTMTSVERPEPVTTVPPMTIVRETEVAEVRPTASTVTTRILVIVFGLVQGLLLARILLLLLDARRENEIVAGVLSTSQVLVTPFEGIFRFDTLAASGSVLDVAAIVALVAFTVLELMIVAIADVPRGRTAA